MTFCIGRRAFITLLGSAGAAWPLAARAQHNQRTRLIGVLMNLAADYPEAQPFGFGNQVLISSHRKAAAVKNRASSSPWINSRGQRQAEYNSS